MKKRILFACLALVLALGTVRALCPRPPAESMKEYCARLYPQLVFAGDSILEHMVYDYPMLRDKAAAVLVVTPEEALAEAAGSGYSVRESYTGTDPRYKYHFYNVKSLRQVKVLKVLKGRAEPGDAVWVQERCAVVEDMLVRTYESWPMVKGCVYLLFLDREPGTSAEGSVPAMTVSRANGWFDLTHLSLNDPGYLHVLTAALEAGGLLTQDRREAGERILSTAWTERGYALHVGRTEAEAAAAEIPPHGQRALPAFVWQGRVYRYTGMNVRPLPAGFSYAGETVFTGEGEPSPDWGELQGNTPGSLYTDPEDPSVVWFRWGDWDTEKNGEAPYWEFAPAEAEAGPEE